MRYYIADLHFFHANMNDKYDKRGFEDVESMNRYMIEQWNSRVKKRDEIVVLGDFSYGSAEQTNELLKELKGRIYLLRGNHDLFLNRREFDQSRFEWVKEYAEMHDNGRRVILCHYPIMCYRGQFNRTNKGNYYTYMLHGHVHNTEDQNYVDQYVQKVRSEVYTDKEGNEAGLKPCNMINCFCKYSDYLPLTLDEWIEEEENRRAKNEN